MTTQTPTKSQVIYDVVMNHEEQYSIWLADRALPKGWQRVGKNGSKEECLTYIEEVWTDMRPLSLRKHMAALQQEQSQIDYQQLLATDPVKPKRDELVERLVNGIHPVSCRYKSTEQFQESLNRGYVLVKFMLSNGETEVGFQIDNHSSHLRQKELATGQETVHLVGELSLNYVPVRCIADIDPTSLKGTGYLEVIAWPNE